MELWTDGSYSPKTQVGAWAFIIKGKEQIKRAEGFKDSNNSQIRAEIKAIISGLESIKETQEEPISVYSDCQAVINAINNLEYYDNNDWCKTKGGPIAHKDLYLHLYEFLKTSKNTFIFNWIKGHNGHNIITLNVEADLMAGQARINFETNLK